MHRCLHVSEIVGSICSYLSVVNDGEKNQSNDLVALLRTCRALYESTLPFVWSEMKTLAPLIMCMPEDLWRVQSRIIKLKREIRPTDWLRFEKHAFLVRRLGLNYGRISPQVDLAAYQSLQLATGGRVLLPNIQYLSWPPSHSSLFKDEGLPFIPMVLGPQLQKFSYYCQYEPSDLVSTFIASLPRWSPSLTDITIRTIDSSDAIEAAVSTAVMGWSRLCSVSLEDINTDAFVHIAQLPTLRSFTFIPRSHPNIPSALSLPAFPYLTRLNLISDSSLELGIRLFELMSPGSALSTISIASGEDAEIDISKWSELFRVIGEICCTKTLRELDISDYSTLDIGFEAETASPEFQVLSDQLKLLFPFANLTYLDLSTYHGFDLNDNLIKEMTLVWPKLESLSLVSGCRPASDPPLTLSSLVPFVQYSRHLSFLAITLNARIIPNTRHAVKISNHTLRTLDIGFSPIASAVVPQVAAFLSDLFPKLTKISNHHKMFRFADDPPEERSDKDWSMVQTLTKTFAEVREEEIQRMKALIPKQRLDGVDAYTPTS